MNKYKYLIFLIGVFTLLNFDSSSNLSQNVNIEQMSTKFNTIGVRDNVEVYYGLCTPVNDWCDYEYFNGTRYYWFGGDWLYYY